MTVVERLTPERMLEIRLCLAGDPEGLLLAEQRYLFAHIDAQQAEIDRLRALLGEALTALRHVETGPDMWLDCCRNAIAPVLAKLVQEGLS